MTAHEVAAAVADVVHDHVTLALAPVVADVKLLQAQLVGWDARWNDLGALRERVAVVEAFKVQPVPETRQPTEDALMPVLERLGVLRDRVVAVETKAAQPLSVQPDPVVADLRDRLLVMETKAALAAPVDLSDVTQRLATLEGREVVPPRVPDPAIDDLRDRLVTLETRSAGPSLSEMGLVELRDRFTALERRVHDDSLARELGGLRERVAVVEVRPAMPGPPGEPGPAGRDGVDGKDGTAGLAFTGVYQEGKTYDVGQLATWAGSSWHCNEMTTTKPGDGSKAWTLMVKRGRDGKDGRDALGALPVVSVGGPR